MSNKYNITGVELGMLQVLDKKERKEIINNIINNKKYIHSDIKIIEKDNGLLLIGNYYDWDEGKWTSFERVIEIKPDNSIKSCKKLIEVFETIENLFGFDIINNEDYYIDFKIKKKER